MIDKRKDVKENNKGVNYILELLKCRTDRGTF